MIRKEAIQTVHSKSVKFPDFTGGIRDSTLNGAPENYVSARHLHKELDIWAATARSWRNRGKIRATKVGTTWFYSKQDLSKLIEQRNKEMFPITIDGKPTKRQDIRSAVLDAILKEAFGDHMSARDVQNKAGIKDGTLRKWRRSGKLRAKKVRGTWYYSKQDLARLIASSK